MIAAVRGVLAGKTLDSALIVVGGITLRVYAPLSVLAELRVEMEPQHFLDASLGWPTGLFPGALELIESIPRRFTRAVLSNSR